jgi:hypothetical protein
VYVILPNPPCAISTPKAYHLPITEAIPASGLSFRIYLFASLETLSSPQALPLLLEVPKLELSCYQGTGIDNHHFVDLKYLDLLILHGLTANNHSRRIKLV